MIRKFGKWYRIKAQGLDEKLAVSFSPWPTMILLVFVTTLICGLLGRHADHVQPWVAAFGGVLAVEGVFISLRPIFRLGGYQNWRKYQLPTECPQEGYEWIFDDEADHEEQRKDDEAQQIIAPAMIGVGTFINAFSGFLPS